MLGNNKPILRWRWWGVLALVPALLAGACGSTDDGGAELSVVATTTIWADVADAIVGDQGTVTSLTPVGADPHSFSPSPSQVATMVEADLVIANGLGLEAAFEDVLRSVEADGVIVLWVGEAVDPVTLDDRTPCVATAGRGPACDPHVWMDPERVAQSVAVIVNSLQAVEPGRDWQASADAYLNDLNSLTASMADRLDDVPPERQVLVTNHDSLGYLADRFGYAIAATVIPGGSTLGSPSSADLAELVATMRTLGVDVIFADTTDSTSLAETVADELGSTVTVVELYTGSLGPSGSGADSLLGMLQTNAELIAGALE